MKLKIFFLLSVLVYLPSIIFANIGSESGNAGDLMTLADGSAWFLGAKPIRTCTVTASNFGVSQGDAQLALSSAFKIWQNYLVSKKINVVSPEKAEYFKGDYGNSGYFISMNFILLPSCDGSQDLKVYFGTRDEVVEKEILKFQNPLGFAARTSYDPHTGWGKGFIWIASSRPKGAGPLWTEPYLLQGLLLHELGHIAGVGHVPNTIMDENIADFIVNVSYDEAYAQRLYSNIDHRAELYVCETCLIDLQSDESYSEVLTDGFKAITGHVNRGNIHGKVIQQSPSSPIRLILADNNSQWSSEITIKSGTAHTTKASSLFKRMLEVSPKSEGTASLKAIGFSQLGQALLPSGEKIPVIVNRNMMGSLEIKTFSLSGDSKFIFIPKFVDFE